MEFIKDKFRHFNFGVVPDPQVELLNLKLMDCYLKLTGKNVSYCSILDFLNIGCTLL